MSRFFEYEAFCTRIPITHSDKLYNIVAIIRAVNADSVFPLPLLSFFPYFWICWRSGHHFKS